MDLVVKSRGTEVSDQFRKAVSLKGRKLSRLEPRAVRLEIEVISERNPRLNGVVRLQGTLEVPRRKFRARARGSGLEGVLDQLLDRLERQLHDHRDRRRSRLAAGWSRLKSGRRRPEEGGR
jgi:ribosomal subunit interface protein